MSAILAPPSLTLTIGPRPMPLLRLEKASLAFGHRPLLEQVNMDVRSGERVCLLGRNGEGKSSLLHLFTGQVQPDSGIAWIRPGTRVAHLAQEVAIDSTDEVFDVVAGGLPGVGKLLTDYHHAAADLAHADNPATARRLADLQLFNELPYRCGMTLDEAIAKKQVKVDAKLYEKQANCWISARDFSKAIGPLGRAADMASSGDLYVRLGEVQIQRSEWGDAAKALQNGLRKGGLKDQGNAQLLLGISQFNQKNYGAAGEAFNRARGFEKHRKMADGYLQLIKVQKG